MDYVAWRNGVREILISAINGLLGRGFYSYPNGRPNRFAEPLETRRK